MKTRCKWAGTDPQMVAYHDEEWGVPEYDSRALWEKLLLDGFQAGLSWSIILRKRDSFRKAFKNFDPDKVARFRDLAVDHRTDRNRRRRWRPLRRPLCRGGAAADDQPQRANGNPTCGDEMAADHQKLPT